MLRGMSSRQVAEWMAYYRHEPFGQDHQHAMMSQLLAILASVHRDRKQHPKQYTADEFMPGLRVEPDPEAKQAALKARINDAMATLAARARASAGRQEAQSKRKTK